MGMLDAGPTTRAQLTRPASVATAITASPMARISFDQPRVSTTSAAGVATPYAGRNPTPITAPSYVNPQPVYRAPAPVYQQPYYPPAQQQWQQPQNFAPVEPPPPPRPQFAPGGREEFNRFAPEQQQMTEGQWLGGDSDYTAQMGLYQKALDDFVRRITGRIQGFETDAVEATAGNRKNETLSADQLGQDFGARGLSFSGMFDTEKNKLQDRYKTSRGNIEKNKVANVSNARNDEADYRSENEISRGNAKRSSLLRMAAQQQLKDAQY